MAENKSNKTILDLDKLMPERRVVKMGGREIDVSKISARVMFEISRKYGNVKESMNMNDEDALELVCSICRPSFPDITVDWLLDNTDMEGLLSLIEFVLAPLNERTEKNIKAAQDKMEAVRALKLT